MHEPVIPSLHATFSVSQVDLVDLVDLAFNQIVNMYFRDVWFAQKSLAIDTR
jgi:hypothetical protein